MFDDQRSCLLSSYLPWPFVLLLCLRISGHILESPIHGKWHLSCLFTHSFSVLLRSVMKWQALECFFFFFSPGAGNEIFSIFLQPSWWHGLCYCCSDTDIPVQHTYMIKMPVQQTDDKWLVTSPLPPYQPHTDTCNKHGHTHSDLVAGES